MPPSIHRLSLAAVATALITVVAGNGHAQSPPATHTRVNASPAPGTTAFVDVSVIPMDQERVLSHQTVVVQQGRITALGPVGDVHVPNDAVRIEGKDKFLIPGLADMHAHLQYYDSATVARVLFLFVANGITTIRNMDYMPYPPPDGSQGPVLMAKIGGPTLLNFRAATASGALLGPRIYTSAAWGGGRPADMQTIMSTAFKQRQSQETQGDVDSIVTVYKAAGYDFIKVHDEDPTLYEYLVKSAQKIGIPFAGHVPDGVPLDQVLAAHQKSIEHLTGYTGQLTSPSNIPTLVAATKRADVWNCPTLVLLADNAGASSSAASMSPAEVRLYTPNSQLRRDTLVSRWQTPSDSSEPRRTLAADRRFVKTLQDSGAGLLLGTDVPAIRSAPGFAVHHELEAMVEAGLTPYQALVTGTRNVAAYFGTTAESGTIAVGKRANLVLLNGNPLTDIRQTAQAAGVMVQGRWLSRAALDRGLAESAGKLENPFDHLAEIINSSGTMQLVDPSKGN